MVKKSNSVVIIHGATGSGKSTQLPQFILDHYVQRSAYCSIVVTQPRKIGASSIARWISKERAWTLGGVVGYQVGLEKIATEDTRLIYMTTGVLLQKIVSAKSLMEFTHIIIDERKAGAGILEPASCGAEGLPAAETAVLETRGAFQPGNLLVCGQ
ncbi:ATP-dependent RNA helicase tdrd9 [Saguinus oedipus]|uniref:ATP-dependent RNA helicase tdrd9 n=1 Tax=Saguinus oedipus TaxID=9490 RepID=A0ABQ9V7B7_SAGOE|nr:ATP-dependent RNA helicase tdrd9 [Saguinus oedipus]